MGAGGYPGCFSAKGQETPQTGHQPITGNANITYENDLRQYLVHKTTGPS